MTKPWTLAPLVDPSRLRGLSHVALPALENRPAEHLDSLAEAGAFVAGVRLEGDLTLPDVADRRAQLRRLERQLTDAAQLGAPTAWLEVPAFLEEAACAYLREGLLLLDAAARARRVCLAIGRSLVEVPEIPLALSADHPQALREAGSRLRLVLVSCDRLPPATEALLTEIDFRGIVVLLGQSAEVPDSTQAPQ